MSEMNAIDIGVPQGSVLGPLLLLIFINKITDYVNEGALTMFADDTTVMVSAMTPEELKQGLKSVLDQFDGWCKANSLVLNLEKTVYIHFRTRSKSPIVEIDYLNHSKNTKFLGLCVEDTLSWQVHVKYVVEKINSGYFAINRLKDSLETKELLSIYDSLIYSHLSYNVIFWGDSIESNRVFIAQKRVIRLLFSVPSLSSCRPYFMRHGILTFPCLYIFKTLLYIKHNENTHPIGQDFHSKHPNERYYGNRFAPSN